MLFSRLSLGIPKLLLYSSAALSTPLKTIINGKNEPSYFAEQSTEEMINKSLKTGDIVLIKRKLSLSRPYRSLLSLLSRHGLQGDFDNVGVIIMDDTRNQPFVLENDFGQISYTPFEERTLQSNDEIVVRFLNQKGFDKKGMENVNAFIANYGRSPVPGGALGSIGEYRDTLASLLYATPSSVDPKFSVYHAFCVVECEKRREALIKAAFLRQTEGEFFDDALDKADGLIRRHSELIKEFAELKLKSKKNKALRYSGPALVAQVYKELGLLPESPPAECYTVDSFADVKCKKYGELKLACLPLKHNAWLESAGYFSSKK